MKFRSGEINIVCTDLKKSLEFYQNMLGFDFIEEDSGAVRLKNDSTCFLLLPFAKETRPKATYCHNSDFSFDLLVSDLSEAYKFFKEHGVSFDKEWKEGEQNFVIIDPDNLFIEIVGI